MASIPKNVREAWANREGVVILATVSEAGVPNLSYVTEIELLGEDCLVLADCTFGKTRRNLMNAGQGALLFCDQQGRSYQIKGALEYQRDGAIFTKLKIKLPPATTLHGVALLRVEEVYSGVVAD